MCRFFAVRASGAVGLAGPLVESPTSLVAQSCCDRRGESHGDGWGLAWLTDGEMRVRRSTAPARDDQQLRDLATTTATTLAIAHVRQASVGQVSLANTHPFQHGRWVFAHNGTLQNFAAGRARLLEAIPADLQAHIAGATDSEHIFYYLLGKLHAVGSINHVRADQLAGALTSTVHTLDQWFPTFGGDETKLNFLVMDGRLLAATCWKHTLHVLEESADRSPGKTGKRSVMIASEPTHDGPWQAVPDRSMIVVDEELCVRRWRLDT